MKLARLFGLAVLLIGASFTIFADESGEVAVETVEYIKVKKPLPNVYVRLDPKSDIIRQAKTGERLEIIAKGMSGSWYKVKIDGKEGWLEAKTGDIVKSKDAPVAIMYVLFIILFLACAGAVAFYIKKSQASEKHGGDSFPDDDDDLDDLDDLDDDDDDK